MKQLDALEKLFAHEIAMALEPEKHRWPLQPRDIPAATRRRLLALGQVEEFNFVIGAGSRFPVTCPGIGLTHAGRYRFGSERGEDDAEEVADAG